MARSSQVRFAVCIDNSGYRASLERHKIYRVIPDKDAADDGDLRIIDESGEDHLYEAERLLLVDLPPKVIRVLSRSFANAQTIARYPALAAAAGVLWGYGSREELEAAGADTLMKSMEQLCEWAGRPTIG